MFTGTYRFCRGRFLGPSRCGTALPTWQSAVAWSTAPFGGPRGRKPSARYRRDRCACGWVRRTFGGACSVSRDGLISSESVLKPSLFFCIIDLFSLNWGSSLGIASIMFSLSLWFGAPAPLVLQTCDFKCSDGYQKASGSSLAPLVKCFSHSSGIDPHFSIV